MEENEDIKKYLVGEYDSSAGSICPSLYIEIDEDENDNSIPHFHIKDSEDEEFDVPICFESANFFSHKDQHNGFLCDTEIEEIVEGFNYTSENNSEKTVWENIIFLWNKFHPKRTIDESISIPNYSEDMEWI